MTSILFKKVNYNYTVILFIVFGNLVTLINCKLIRVESKIPLINSSSINQTNLNQSLIYPIIYGFRVEEVSSGTESYDRDGISTILADTTATIRLIGQGFDNNTLIKFVTKKGIKGVNCNDLSSPSNQTFHIVSNELNSCCGISIINLPSLEEEEEEELGGGGGGGGGRGRNDVYFICTKSRIYPLSPWIHQGTDPWLQIKTYTRRLPLWFQIVLILILLILSGLLSGLNLGLMSLDRTEMKIIIATGNDKERSYAKRIQPLRDNGNYLLCSLILVNVLVNSTLTIVLDDISSGFIAIIGSTLSIVILGEIVPQAICSRHALKIGAQTAWLTKIFMALTFPISYPISCILDKMLGEEIGIVYNRDKLKELITVTIEHNDLEKGEIHIISGALTLKKKIVEDVMTPLAEIFMLSAETILDNELLNEIRRKGFSKIPIYDRDRNRIVSVLNTSDLVFVDSNDKLQLKILVEEYSRTCFFVFSDATLDVMFNAFKTGNRGHMAFVQRLVNGDDAHDPYCEIIGLITLEDILMDWWPERY